MRSLLQIILLSGIISACTSSRNSEYTYSSDQLKIKALSENVFMHISYLTTNDFGKVDCNGMIYLNGDDAIVFDTPTDDNASAELINWVETQGKKVKAVIVTHFHDDCLGGLKQFHNHGIHSYANNQTITLVKEKNEKVIPEIGFDHQIELTIGSESVYCIDYGAGHTEDNIVGYIPSEKALFGGCLIKTMNANRGFTGDANLAQWPLTVDSLKRELPQLKIVIPGHGAPGGTELLDYTINLFKSEPK